MYYIAETEEELIKYEVEVDKDMLEELKVRIIDNCSTISHVVFNSSKVPTWDFFNREIKSKYIGSKEYQDGPDENIYQISCYKYTPTQLVEYIEELINDNGGVVEKLKKYQCSQNPVSNIEANIVQHINSMHNDLSSDISKIDTDKLIKEAEKLAKLKEQIELNKDTISDKKYYDKLMEYIKLVEVSRISKKDLQRVENFYEGTNQKIKKKGEM